EDDEMLMALDGFTGSMTSCLADGCYKVEMHDSFGDGWNGAWAEMMVNGESVGTMSLSEGSYESTYVGVNAECTADNDGSSSTPSLVSVTEPAWSFDVWPNPGTSALNLQVQGIRAGTPLELVVLNAQGQRVASQALPVAAKGQTTVIETDGWAPGVYIVRLSQQHHATQRQWIKLD
ncbi:MAG: T9SS type A sorting domain-containing protein, partial [Bacteroidota bacterium]|nr:T9SS type A sorting domain-containing protein [Bacteroidota bacterium]